MRLSKREYGPPYDPTLVERMAEFKRRDAIRSLKLSRTATKRGVSWWYEYDTSAFNRCLLVLRFEIRGKHFLMSHKGYLRVSKLEREYDPRRVIAEKWREVRRQIRDYRGLSAGLLDYTPSSDLGSPVEGP